MSKPVRVRDKRTGHTYTTTEAAVAKQAAHLEILKDHPATDQDGRFLAPKPNIKPTAKPAASSKENSK